MHGNLRRFSAAGLFMTAGLLKQLPASEVFQAVQHHLEEGKSESHVRSSTGLTFHVLTDLRGVTSCYLDTETSGFEPEPGPSHDSHNKGI